jgi:hypothetical protein
MVYGGGMIVDIARRKPTNETVVHHDVANRQKEREPVLVEGHHRDHEEEMECISIRPPDR